MVKLCRLVGLKNVFYFKYGPDVPLKGHLDKNRFSYSIGTIINKIDYDYFNED